MVIVKINFEFSGEISVLGYSEIKKCTLEYIRLTFDVYVCMSVALASEPLNLFLPSCKS